MHSSFQRFKKRYAAQQRSKVRAIKRAGGHPAVVIPFVTISVLLLLSVVGVVVFSGGKPKLRTMDTHVVIINHDRAEQTIPTRARTVGEVLQRAEVILHEGDVVEPDQDTEVVSDNFRINVYRAVPVTIVDGTKKTFAYSAAKTPRSIVKQAGIEVYPEDTLALLPVDNFLIEGSIGERVVVERATPVNLNIYGTQVAMRTHAKTVGDLLKEREVKLQPSDTVQPAVETPITPNVQIFLVRQGTQIATEEATIAMPTQIVEDTSLSFGATAIRQQGSAGRKLVTYQIQLENGKEVGRRIIQEVITVEAVPKIIARGKAVQIPDDKQAVMAAAGIAVSDYPYVDFVVSHESGWCPTKTQGQIGYCPAYAPDTVPSGLGYGLGQATPGTKMSSFGSDWKTSAITQLKWATSYAKGRYGSWEAAYDFWQSHRYW
jgi:uncharacterized protein YabE (DUF348 family)